MRLLRPGAYLPTVRGLAHNALRREAVHPFYASFKITSRCHFGCPFCNMRGVRMPDRSTEAIKEVLDNLSRSSVLMTSFEGGEPLLREDIGELLAYARTKSFYLLFTTSVRDPEAYPLDEYARSIDFLHVSIDEGHGNLDMFDKLPGLCALPTQVSVQTVVTRDTVDALDGKVRRCHEAGANIVIIPASPMDGAEDCFPDIPSLARKVRELRRRYPRTIHTPRRYFDAYEQHRCSPASIIIAPDCRIYYPCHILGTKGPDLSETDLRTWLQTDDARRMRATMRACTRNCGWYQYYSIESYVSPGTAWESLAPMVFQKRRRGRA
ncbi:MAG: radical SAM protein [Chitinivibrionales bacterium]|nr:radical SAM protein [Chitinivibrionales bacterium]MBD3395929.1 radical SAM protein [Chitinivibrionales bacterium]